ncbi:MAG TPA: homocysteine S-methyltransferase family protein [Spirochaetia bacterium]|nr:homocysteine S-methyltransferase family protein [Spirochaetales bacterium]HRY79575.1 homocysteine S-methyltransferase family protein [Spirochaetia bacterium]
MSGGNRASDRDIRTVFGNRLLLADGSTGTALEELAPGRSATFLPLEAPEIVEELHRAYFDAGSDLVETATFGANERALAKAGAPGAARELNRAACEAAVRAARRAEEADGRPRWVAGSVGPGEDPPSLGASTYAELVESYRPQMAGLLEGGADLVFIETCQDPLQVKAALGALFDARAEVGREVPFIVSATVDASGRMLTGTGMEALAAIVAPFRPLALGLNCSGGPAELAAALEALARASPAPLSLMPNAGFPRLEAGRAVYPMGPGDFARETAALARRFGVSLAGGCCGTGPAHIRALAGLLADRPRPSPRPARKPGLASLYQAWPPESGGVSKAADASPAAFLRVGEKANAAGSAAFAKRVLAGDVEGQAALALAQEESGAHALDLHLSRPGRDEAADLAALTGRLAGTARAALSLDSPDPEVLAAALPLVGGRPLLNSANLEDEAKARRVFRLARRFGAAVVCLALDGGGPARDTAGKVRICRALHDLALEEGLAPEDLYFDCLTFSLASESGGFEGAAARTLEAIPRVKEACPGSSTILGVGNCSFGLPRPLRPPVTAVFLEAARAAGLDAAILDPGLPDPETVDVGIRSAVRTLIGGEAGVEARAAALDSLLARAPGAAEAAAQDTPGAAPEDRLRAAILRGEAGAAARAAREAAGHPPVTSLVASAMSEVGARFSAGDLPLPRVLRSAEAAQAALGELTPGSEVQGLGRGTVVMATVKGDLHDIGKNLTGLILGGSGYRVVDLGTDVGIERLLAAVGKEGAAALGLSGLLTRSLEEMRKAARALGDSGSEALLLLGGAAVDPRFVEAELAPLHPGRVRACADAFEALRVLAKDREPGASDPATGPATRPAAAAPAAEASGAPSDAGPALPGAPAPDGRKRSRIPGLPPTPPWTPPFRGSRPADGLSPEELFAALDRKTLLQVRWGFGRRGREEAEESFERISGLARSRGLCRAAGVYGYFSCEHRGGGLLRVDDGRGGAREFRFPGAGGPGGPTIAAYFDGEGSVIPFFAVTAGPELSRAAAELRASGDPREYFLLHGLAAALAEAAAEVLHRRIGRELEAAGAGTAGRRYSFGFPGCPGVEFQGELLGLLGAARVGIGVTEGHQLTPEFSVTAFVVPRPDAEYFSPP